MLPCPVIEGNIHSIPEETLRNIRDTNCFLVEKAKTARHFIKAAGHPRPISELRILEISEDKKEMDEFLTCLDNGENVGVISEAGCPGIADPGASVVSWAHRNGYKVVPFVGPSSILMALMASGMNGQNFTFNGYLSNKKPELVRQLKALEQTLSVTGYSQIFMDTPYRNIFLMENCIQTLRNETILCIACDINGSDSFIVSDKIINWKKFDLNKIHKRPTIFILGSF